MKHAHRLWSLLFAKHDSDRSGTFSLVERTSFLSYLHNASLPFSANDAVLPIRRPYRESSSRFLPSYEAIDVPPPSTTEPRFLSGDGYTLVRNLGNDPWQFPVFTMPADASPACKLDLVTCFGTDFMSAEEGEVDAAAIMRRLAVEEPRCGDCLITAGLAQSGTVGLEGFLPPAEDGGRTARLTERAVRPPLLALTKRYEDATWSWDEVEGQLDAFDGLRDFAVRLIQRYSHTVGASPPFSSPGLRVLTTAQVTRRIISSWSNDLAACVATSSALDMNLDLRFLASTTTSR